MGSHMMKSPHEAARLLKARTEDLTGFNHIYHPDGPPTHHSSKVMTLKIALTVGMEQGQNEYSKHRGGFEETPIA